MLTKNFYHFVMSRITGKTIPGGVVDPAGTVYPAYFDTSVQSFNWSYMKTLKVNSGAISSLSTSGVYIGTGVTPATADDYTLEARLTDGLSVVNPSDVTVTKENGFVAVYATYTVTNTGTTAVAISEIGLFSGIHKSSGSSVPALMDRTVLEKPIVINPGEAKPITYTIRFNYPTEV